MGQPAERSDGPARLAAVNPRPLIGRVARAVGTTIEATLSDARIGEICQLRDPVDGTTAMAEVIGVSDGKALLVLLGDLAGLSTRTEVSGTRPKPADRGRSASARPRARRVRSPDRWCGAQGAGRRAALCHRRIGAAGFEPQPRRPAAAPGVARSTAC